MVNKNILIAGLGNIGKRYLESINNSNFKYNVYILEKNYLSYTRTKKNLKNDKFKHKVKICFKQNQLAKNFFLAIIATTADVRVYVTKLILKKKVKYWIFEKPLGQSLDDIIFFKKNFIRKNSWINLPRTSFKLFSYIKKLIKNKKIKKIEVRGNNWGLCCNGIHYLYLFSWLLNSSIKAVDYQGLKKWQPAKRKGFWEVEGQMNVIFKNNTKGVLKADIKSEKEKTCKLSIYLNKQKITYDEIKKCIYFNNKVQIRDIKIPLLSKSFNKTLDKIKVKKNCDLPPLRSVVTHHEFFLKSLIKSWAIYKKRKINFAPIT